MRKISTGVGNQEQGGEKRKPCPNPRLKGEPLLRFRRRRRVTGKGDPLGGRKEESREKRRVVVVEDDLGAFSGREETVLKIRPRNTFSGLKMLNGKETKS